MSYHHTVSCHTGSLFSHRNKEPKYTWRSGCYSALLLNPQLILPMLQHRKYSLCTGITNPFMGLSWRIAKIHEKNSNSRWTRLPKLNMYLPLQLLPVATSSWNTSILYIPKYSVAKSHKHSARKQRLQPWSFWDEQSKHRSPSLSTWMNIKSPRTLEQFGQEDWENHISAYMPDHVSEPSPVNVTAWIQGLLQNQGEKRQPEYAASRAVDHVRPSSWRKG